MDNSILFATGLFQFMENDGEEAMYAVPNMHIDEEFDDDVLSWALHDGLEKLKEFDGFVSNAGSVVTVHILKDKVSDSRKGMVEVMMALNTGCGVSEIIYKAFDNWDEEVTNAHLASISE